MPQGKMKTNSTTATVYNIKEWMQGLKEDTSKAELRNDKMSSHGTEWKTAHSQYLGRSRRQYRRQGAPQLLRNTSSGSPSAGGRSSDWRSEWSSHQLTITRWSRESN